MASCKSFVCAHDWHVNSMQNCIHFGLYLHTDGCAFPSLFSPPSVMAPVHSKPLLDACFREEEVLLIFLLCKQHKISRQGNERWVAVITRPLVIQRNVFVDQFYELLCFFLGDFADLSDENKGHTHLLTHMVQHRSLHGPVKIHTSGSIAVSLPCTWNHALVFPLSRFLP